MPNLDEDWWTPAEVSSYLGISAKTWNSYVSRGQAPVAERFFGRTPAWRSATVKAWKKARPGRGSRSDLTKNLNT
jgi:predicted DNA-binding transcriptional regulator AlpA